MAETSYIKTEWKDHIVNPENGEIIQQGTRFTAERANNLEVGIESAHEELATHQADDTKHLQEGERIDWNAKETPEGVRRQIEQTAYSTTKSGLDAESIYTIVEQRRAADNTLAKRATLSGGTTPLYTTRTIQYFGTDGETVVLTDVFTLTYNSDDIWESEVLT